MKPGKLTLAFTVLLAGAVSLHASGPLGIYGIVEKVVYEPNDKMPERVQVWGAFAYVETSVVGQSLTVSVAKKGYLYFRLGGASDTVIRNGRYGAGSRLRPLGLHRRIWRSAAGCQQPQSAIHPRALAR